MGANPGQVVAGLAKGGLSGLGQGLQQYGNPNPVFNFQRPAMGQGVTPNAKKQALTQTQQMNPFSATPFSGNYT